MPFNITRPTSIQAVVISLILIGLILIPTNNIESTTLTLTPIQQMLNGILNSCTWIAYVVSFLLLSTTTVFIGRIGMRSSALAYRGYAPMVIFLTLILSSINVTDTPRTLLSVLFIMLALNHMMNSRKSENIAAGEWAAIGWWTALAAIVSSEALIMFLIIPIGLLSYRTWNTKEFIAALGGFLLPFALIHLTYIIIGTPAQTLVSGTENLWLYTSFLDKLNEANIIQQSFGAFILVCLIISIATFLLKLNSLLAIVRGYIFYLILSITLIGWMILIPAFTPTVLALLYIPLSIVIAKGFESKKNNRWLTILYILFIAGAITCKYHNHFLVFLEKNI